MKNKKLRYFVLLMSFALVGLIALQFYWVNVAIHVSKERFQQNVHEALNEVSRQLEQKEVIYVTERLNNPEINLGQLLSVSLDSLEGQESNNIVPQTSMGVQTSLQYNTTNYVQEKPVITQSLETQPEPLTTQKKNISILQDSLNTFTNKLQYPNKQQQWRQRNQQLQRQTQSIVEYEYDPFGTMHKYFEFNMPLNYPVLFEFPLEVLSGDNFRDRNPMQAYTKNRRTNRFSQIYISLGRENIKENSDLRVFTKSSNRETIPKEIALKTPAVKFPKMEEDHVSKKPEKDMEERKMHLQKLARKKKPEFKKEVVHITSKSDMVAFVVEELKNNIRKKSIRERASRQLLDSLLKKELKNRGVDIGYNFIVETKPHGEPSRYFYVDRPLQKQKILKNGFHTHLFPTEITRFQHLLHIDFPNQQAFILKKMGWVFASSLLFVGLVVFCFVQAISTIIKQKKVSEVTNDFINNMTHEFKTPISTVSLACEAMQDPDVRQLPNQVDRYLNIIKEENERLGSQVEKVLQIAVLDKGDFKLKITSVNLHKIIDKAIRNNIIQVENRHGKITTSLDATQIEIEADELHISNVIHNLLDNANKYSVEAPQIMIQTQNTQTGIRIAISDQGQGMGKETINKVFDKFYRVSTGNIHNVKGFGLGLSYVKTMVEAHHGKIHLKSELGKGSTFTIDLPYTQTKA